MNACPRDVVRFTPYRMAATRLVAFLAPVAEFRNRLG
jgi:hypothetical protein